MLMRACVCVCCGGNPARSFYYHIIKKIERRKVFDTSKYGFYWENCLFVQCAHIRKVYFGWFVAGEREKDQSLLEMFGMNI